MKQPFPWLMRSAEVRISGETLQVSAHNLTFRWPLRKELAAAVWEQLGARPGQVSVEIKGEAVQVWLAWDGITVEMGPLKIHRIVRNNNWYNWLKSRQEIEMEAEMVAA